MIDMDVVLLSRLQFAMTAMYHFLFVPLTLGLSLLMAIMESVYVMTGREIWRRMTLFWGTLFGINFAMGVATGIVMEFQFGMNWSYYSHYVGDVFGAPLAIEGLMAFFLEATFIGLFFFGWDRLSKLGHLAVTWLVALGANFSALWILIANGWMQNPVGATFNPDTMRMEIADFVEVIFNPVAQAKFVHTVSAGYVTGAIFVMSVSAFYLLRGRHRAMARRSMAVASSFGLAAALSVVVLGDESGYIATEHQKMKLAAMEGMWHAEPAPAPFTVFALPDQEAQSNRYEVQVPFALGLIATRSFTQELPGILDLVESAEGRIRDGLLGYEALRRLRQDEGDDEARALVAEHWPNMGYALLLKRYREDILNASEEEVAQAALDTVPGVAPLFWTFRIMVGLGFYFIAFFVVAFWLSSRGGFERNRWFLHAALWSLPLPWIAAELGWFVAEYGRQPWIIEGVLSTFYAVSDLTVWDVGFTIAGFATFYTALAVVEVWLLLKFIRKGPAEPTPAPQPAPRPRPAGAPVPAVGRLAAPERE